MEFERFVEIFLRMVDEMTFSAHNEAFLNKWLDKMIDYCRKNTPSEANEAQGVVKYLWSKRQVKAEERQSIQRSVFTTCTTSRGLRQYPTYEEADLRRDAIKDDQTACMNLMMDAINRV